MKVRKNEVLKIKPGETKSFHLERSLDCNTARVTVQYVKRCHKPENIETYKTSIDWKNLIIYITAVAKKTEYGNKNQ